MFDAVRSINAEAALADALTSLTGAEVLFIDGGGGGVTEASASLHSISTR